MKLREHMGTRFRLWKDMRYMSKFLGVKPVRFKLKIGDEESATEPERSFSHSEEGLETTVKMHGSCVTGAYIDHSTTTITMNPPYSRVKDLHEVCHVLYRDHHGAPASLRKDDPNLHEGLNALLMHNVADELTAYATEQLVDATAGNQRTSFGRTSNLDVQGVEDKDHIREQIQNGVLDDSAERIYLMTQEKVRQIQESGDVDLFFNKFALAYKTVFCTWSYMFIDPDQEPQFSIKENDNGYKISGNYFLLPKEARPDRIREMFFQDPAELARDFFRQHDLVRKAPYEHFLDWLSESK